MDGRDGESDAYGDEQAPPSYYVDAPPPKLHVSAPLITDGSHPHLHVHRPGDALTVVAMPTKGDEIICEERQYESCHLVCSFISAFICALFGMIALVFAIMGYTDIRTGNYVRYKSKKKCAVGWTVAAWLCGGAIIGLILFLRTRSQYNNHAGWN